MFLHDSTLVTLKSKVIVRYRISYYKPAHVTFIVDKAAEQRKKTKRNVEHRPRKTRFCYRFVKKITMPTLMRLILQLHWFSFDFNILGAGSGIGRETCRVLAREGAKVIAADQNIRTAEETVNILNGTYNVIYL